MKFNKNLLAFIASHSTAGEVFPPEDTFDRVKKEDIFNMIKKYIESGNYKKNPYLGLYFNFPYCNEKCMYCCLASIGLTNISKIREFVKELILDVNKVGDFLKDYPEIEVDVLYFSGGTFTIIEDELFEELFKSIKNNFKFKKGYSYNLELHPASLNENKVKILKKYGVNKVMLGIQSMDEEVLKNLKRKQTNKQVLKSVNIIKKYKFDTLDVDIIAGLPGEKKNRFIKNLMFIIDYISPDIIHMYPFTPGKNVPYTKAGNIYGDQDKVLRDEMFYLGEKLICSRGYEKSEGYIKKGKKNKSLCALKTYYDMSVISFGYPLDVQGYLEGVGAYTTRYNDIFAMYEYKDTDILIRREMFRLIGVGKNIDILYYNRKYNIDLLSYFREEFDFLVSNKVITFSGDIIEVNLQYIWEKTIYRWIFITEDLLLKFLEKNLFDNNENYFDYFRKNTSEYYN